MIKIICKKRDRHTISSSLPDSLLSLFSSIDMTDLICLITEGDFYGEDAYLIDECLIDVDIWVYEHITFLIESTGTKVFLYLPQICGAVKLEDAEENEKVLPDLPSNGIDKIFVSISKNDGKKIYDVVYSSGKRKRKTKANRAMRFFIVTRNGKKITPLHDNSVTYLYK